ncbi:unnamed protein product [Notodromas monacha]|uniref:RING-CH-type domain-containing protein n=1 Tax=Notodromas monacha TaxID=399045 RepID=A0A7R9BVW6_9CRUS|nr:unnamed protein product [Notodromas monacha]CAG0921626.1 unnamed protein product [Notodromas monacha]
MDGNSDTAFLEGGANDDSGCRSSSRSEKPGYGLCRICHGNDAVHKLIAPCFCKGSLLHVHQGCLEHWLEATSSEKCELCGYQYITNKRPMRFREWIRLSRGLERRRLVADLCCTLTMTPMALTSVALLLNSSLHFGPPVGPRSMIYYLLIALAMLISVVYVYWLLNTLKTHLLAYRLWRMSHFHVKLVLPACNLDRSHTLPAPGSHLHQQNNINLMAASNPGSCFGDTLGVHCDEHSSLYCRSPESDVFELGPSEMSRDFKPSDTKFPAQEPGTAGDSPLLLSKYSSVMLNSSPSAHELMRIPDGFGEEAFCWDTSELKRDARNNNSCTCCRDPWEIQGVAITSPHEDPIRWRQVIYTQARDRRCRVHGAKPVTPDKELVNDDTCVLHDDPVPLASSGYTFLSSVQRANSAESLTSDREKGVSKTAIRQKETGSFSADEDHQGSLC